MHPELIAFYEEYKSKVSAYEFAINSIYFDQVTMTPKKGTPYANEMLSILAGENFSYSTNVENIKKLEQLQQETTDPLLKKEITLRLRDLHQISLLPKEVYVDYQKTVSDCEIYWQEAKGKNDYQMFKPKLIDLITKRKEMLQYFTFTGSSYDYLLDQFQVGMNVEKYDAFFEKLKEAIVPLLQQIQTEGIAIDTKALYRDFPIVKQKAFAKILKKAFVVDSEKCYLTESVHPFTSFFSTNEARITTKYDTNNAVSTILSTIHEYGHALYALQCNPDYEKTTFFNNIGYAMHESQSRLLENHIGRSEVFWKVYYPQLQDLFKEVLSDVSFTDFMAMLNATEPGYIRIEADELTYPLHIIIRYEMEKEIFQDNCDYDTLDTRWADMYQEYLGIRPQTPAEGILQDVHWSAGHFGYFPTYVLGSAIAAQLYHQLEKDVDMETVFVEDNFTAVEKWLQQYVHQYGASKDVDEILLEATGETFNPDYYINYLVTKYKKLYRLK